MMRCQHYYLIESVVLIRDQTNLTIDSPRLEPLIPPTAQLFGPPT